MIAPGVGGSLGAVITNSRIDNNANAGISINSTNGIVTAVIEKSSLSGNATGYTAVSGLVINSFLIDSIVANNSTQGIFGNGGVTTLRVGNTTITGNALGVATANGAQVLTYGNNRLVGNPAITNANNGAFAGPAPALQ